MPYHLFGTPSDLVYRIFFVALAKFMSCYHCHSALPKTHRYTLTLDGTQRLFCCLGCQTIAQIIYAQGLDAFYTQRTAVKFKPSTDSHSVADKLLAYDDEALSQRFLHILNPKHNNIVEVTLKLENIRCAACIWLNEQHLRHISGVKDVRTHYVTQKAIVRFDLEHCKLSTLLAAIEQLGYTAWPFDATIDDHVSQSERQRALIRLGIAWLGMMQVMMYAWPIYFDRHDLLDEHAMLLSWTSALLTLPVISYSAAPIFSNAWQSIKNSWRHGLLSMDVPVAIALVLAFAASAINLVRGTGESYFDSITMFVAFLLTARYIEMRMRHEVQSTTSALAKQLPAVCERFDDFPKTRTIHTVPVVKCQIGDILHIPAGEVIPADGLIVDGYSQVSEALLSGESHPRTKTINDTVYAGSYNLASVLCIQVSGIGQSTRLADITRLLEQALTSRPHLATLSQQWASYFVLALLGLALLTGLLWWYINPANAWSAAVAVLVVSCPCALSLAIPAALAAAQSAATRAGLLIVNGNALETLAQVQDLVLDKTGTLTTGCLQLTHVTIFTPALTLNKVLAIAASMETGQRHPCAMALQKIALQKKLPAYTFKEMPRTLIGQGVAADDWRLGSMAWLASAEIVDVATAPSTQPPHAVLFASFHSDETDEVKYSAQQNDSNNHPYDDSYLTICHHEENKKRASMLTPQSTIWLMLQKKWIARFDFSDTPRAGAQSLIAQAQAAGLTIHLFSGDNPTTVAQWANYFGIKNWQGDMLPETKLAAIQALQKQRRIWAMGDGINDAPLLAQAHVSTAIASGAPLAQAGADIIAMTESLAPLAKIIKHAVRTKKIMRQNLLWAFVYNLVAIPAAALGLITPWLAGIGMSLSSLIVTLNAWRLRKY